MEGTEQEEQSRAGEGEEGEGWWGQDWLFGTDLRQVIQEGSSGQTGENPSFVEFWETIKIIQATIKNVSTSSSISPNIIFEDTMSAPEGRTQEKKLHTQGIPLYSFVLCHLRLCSSFVNHFLPTLLQLIPSAVLSTYRPPIQVSVRITPASFRYSEMGVRCPSCNLSLHSIFLVLTLTQSQ